MITKKKKREDLQYLRDEVLDAYISRPAFQYDANGDALYRHYKDQYTQLGKDAMTDTMGRAAALTGGCGSSYAQSVGQQAYNSYLQKLGDVIPALYQLAYQKYQNEGNRLYKTYQSWANLEQQAARQEQWEREYALAEQESENAEPKTAAAQPNHWAMVAYYKNPGKYQNEKTVVPEAQYDNGNVSEGNIKTMQRILGLEETGKWTDDDRTGAGGLTADDAWKDYQQGKLQSHKSVGLGLPIGNIKTMERVLGLEEDGYWSKEDQKAAGGRSEFAAWKDYQQGKLQSRSGSGMSVDAWTEIKKAQASNASNPKASTPAVQNFIACTVTEDQAAERGVNSTEWKMMVMDRLNGMNMTMDEFAQLEQYYGLDISGGTSDTAGTAKGSAQKMSYAEYRKNTAHEKVSGLNTAVQQYFRAYQAFVNSAVYDIQYTGYNNAANMHDNRVKTAEKLQKQAEMLASALRMNGDILSGDYSDLLSEILSAKANIDSIMDFYNDQAKHYSQWDTEEEYRLWSMTSDEIVAQQGADKLGDIAYTTKGGQNVTWQLLYDQKLAEEDLAERFAAYSKNPDWEEKSKSRDVSADPDRKRDYELIYRLSTMNVAYEKEYALADGITEEEWNEIDQARRYIGEKYGVDLYADPYGSNINIYNELMSMLDDFSMDGGELAQQLFGEPIGKGSFRNMRHLTKDERAVLNYIFNTQGRDAALQWHNSRMSVYQARANGVLSKEMYDWGKGDPLWSSAGSVALSLGSGVEQIFDWLSGETNNTMARAKTAIRSGVSDTTDIMIGNWDAFDFVYNTAMSGADSLVASSLPGGAGAVLLGLSAAAQATNDALDKGMSQKQAFWHGLAAGVFECLFEKFSIGEFQSLKAMKPANIKDIAKNIAKSMLVNASEETATEIANLLYDDLVNGDFSDHETLIRQNMANGMSESEAKTKAAIDLGCRVVESGASGALMGFGAGTTASASAAVQNVFNKAKTNQALKDNSPQITSGALNINPDDAQTENFKAQPDSGKNLSVNDLQTLRTQEKKSAAESRVTQSARVIESQASANGNVINEPVPVNQKDVAKSLRSEGISTPKADSLAQAITARLNGQELTKVQRSILSFELGNSPVQRVISEFIKKKTDRIDSTQSNGYDKDNVVGGFETREEATLLDLAYQRIGGNRSRVQEMLQKIESLSSEVFSIAPPRGLTSEVAVFGDKERVTVMEDTALHQDQKSVSEGSYEGGTDVIKASLVNKVKDIRAIMPNTNLSKRGNMAVADVDIPGIKNNFAAHSKINALLDKGANVADFSYLKPEQERIFTSYVDDQYPRYHDTEAKILEDIASQITDPNVCGIINLYSELPCCQSCSNIILEFRRMFPNIKLNIFVE